MTLLSAGTSTSKILTVLCAVTSLVAMVTAESFFELRGHQDQDQYEKHVMAAKVHTPDQAAKWLTKYGFLNCRKQRKRRNTNPEEEQILGGIVEEGHPSRTGTIRGDLIAECSKTEFKQSLLAYQEMYNLPLTGVLDEVTKENMNSARCGNKDTVDDFSRTIPPTTVSKTIVTPTTTPSQRRRRRRSALNIQEGKAQTSHELNSQPGSETTYSRRAHRARTLTEMIAQNRTPLRRRRKRSLVMNANQTKNVMFSKKTISYRILESGLSTKIPVGEQWKLLDLGFRMWSEVIPIMFRPETRGDVRNVDVKVAFGRGEHQNCYHNFDGNGGEIAHAWYGGNMHLDDDEDFKSTEAEGINFLHVAVHEIGHILGLNHSSRTGSIMHGIYNTMMGNQFELGWEDRKEAQRLYGVCTGRFNLVMDWIRQDLDGTRVFNTYFFRGHKYWMYENRANRTRYGDPQIIRPQWRGVPNNVDGYVHILYYNRARGKIIDTQYFFKGCMVYKFNPSMNRVEHGWPRPMSRLFQNVPCNIDSVVFDARDRQIYFFKDDRVYSQAADLTHCCVSNKTIAEEFPNDKKSTKPLPNKLDSVYYSYSDDTQYFFKGDHVWQNVRYSRYRRAGRNKIMYIGLRAEKWFDICDVDNNY